MPCPCPSTHYHDKACDISKRNDAKLSITGESMSSKPVGGFDLVLGQLYNDGWFNYEPPLHNVLTCAKCNGGTTIHKLHKFILAFGNITEKFTEVETCPHCLHEHQLPSDRKERKQKATKQNFVRIFSKLPKPIQVALLTQAKGA